MAVCILGGLSVHIGKIGSPTQGDSYETGPTGSRPAAGPPSGPNKVMEPRPTLGRLGDDFGPNLGRLWANPKPFRGHSVGKEVLQKQNRHGHMEGQGATATGFNGRSETGQGLENLGSEDEWSGFA